MRADENTGRLSQSFTGKNADVFQGHWVAFLRHDTGRLNVAIGESDAVKLLHRQQQKILDKSTNVNEHHGGGSQHLREVIDPTDARIRIRRRRVKTQQLGGPRSVNRESASGNRASTERRIIDARESSPQADNVAAKYF